MKATSFLRTLAGFLAAALAPGAAGAADKALSDEALLAMFDGMRVADVSDGMDIVGLRDVGLVDASIQALWRDIDDLDHQFCGVALTVRYMPHQEIVPNPITDEPFLDWENRWYAEISSEPFLDLIAPGKVVVIDASGNGDTGSVGSLNSLEWVRRGAVGVVTTGSVRDTDEIIKQQIPLYMDPLQRGRGIRPGRNMVESVNKPVEIGGALVQPGDIIVADGDGVIVVPREHAAAVAAAARPVLKKDKAGRRSLYRSLGREFDQTVKE
ncbi:MAG: RraA family protein [Rhodomicrobium sp.]|nr:RraA family protein [Rhodomicrobium sp.]